MRRLGILLAPLAGLSLMTAPAPLAAQKDTASADNGRSNAEAAADAEMDRTMAMLGSMFPAEPLTAEQQARLPQSQRIIAQMIPEGSLGEMMGGMFETLIGPIVDASGGPAVNAVSRGTGISAEALALAPEQAEELARLFDPAYAERHTREMALMPTFMREMMTVMEPTMRKAMAELYAINFSQKELDDIEAFFQTESGTAYARKSFAMSSDPRIISATMESLPQMMGAFAGLEEKIAAAGADLPPVRDFAALSGAEKARVADLTGYSIAEIEAERARSEAAGETE